jgi:hypothetical protein
VRLGLHANGRENEHAPRTCLLRGPGQQPRLPDPGLATEHERLAARGHVVQERRQQPPFLHATDQWRSLIRSCADHQTPIFAP